MPLYEYQCDACGHRFELIHQKFSDPPASECPKCGGAVQKQVSSPAFQFKGSGWYITDYARKPESARGDTKSEGGGGASKEAATGASKESASKEGGAKESPSKAASTDSSAPASTPTTKSS
jgi:putative FmdB family regulatory protein